MPKSIPNETSVITVPPTAVSPVDVEFEERFKYVNWTRFDIDKIESFDSVEEVDAYIEKRREEALIFIGELPPNNDDSSKKGFSKRKPGIQSDAGDFLQDVGEIFNILKKSKVAKAFQGLGLAINCVDFFMSILNPGRPDPTIELIKEGFRLMMVEMEKINDRLTDLEKMLDWGVVRGLLGPSEEDIRNALGKYTDLQNNLGTSFEDAYFNDFVKFCDNINLENRMRTLCSAFTDTDSVFGMRNLPKWASDNSDQNYGIMQSAFTVVAQLLLPGMHMHLFMCKQKGLNLDYESEQWGARIDLVTEACERELVKIFDTLPDLMDNDVTEYFRKQGFGDLGNNWSNYDRISGSMNRYLVAKYPFANFAVVSYTPMGGSNNHHIRYFPNVARTYLHQGKNYINFHVMFEKKKQTSDWYINWIRNESNKNALQADIAAAKTHLSNNKQGDARNISNGCPTDKTGQRNYLAFIVPDRNVSAVQIVLHSTLTVMNQHNVQSSANGSSWNSVLQRYVGSGSW